MKMGKNIVRKLIYLIICLVVWCIVFGICEGITMLPHSGKIADAESVYYLNQGFAGILLYVSVIMVVLLAPQWFSKTSAKNPEENIGTLESRKKKYKWLVRCILILAILCVACSHWYEVYNLDGVKVHHWNKTKEYNWEEISYYTLDTNGKGLAMYLHMNDGTKVDVFGGSFAISVTNEAFAKQFPDDVYDYAVWLDKVLERQGTELRIKDKEELQKKLMLVDYSVRRVAEIIME